MGNYMFKSKPLVVEKKVLYEYITIIHGEKRWVKRYEGVKTPTLSLKMKEIHLDYKDAIKVAISSLIKKG